MFDSHAHLSSPQFDHDRDKAASRAFTAGLSGWIEVGTNTENSRGAIALAEQHEGVHASVGVHPSDIQSIDEEGWNNIEQLLKSEKVKAVGEVGLDFYRGGTPTEQLPILERFVDLAKRHQLPILFHVRSSKTSDAHDVLIAFLRKHPCNGVIHTFSGSGKQANRYIDLGMYLSFSGVVTFKNAAEIANVARDAPLNRILVETDCPYLSPEPYRGKRNEPAYVKYVVEKIAQLREISFEEVDKKTTENARQLFSI